MKNLRILVIGLLVLVGGLTSCKDDAESPNLSADEQNLIRQPWQAEGVYVLQSGTETKIDSVNVSRISLEFNSRANGLIRDVSINGIPGGSWELNNKALKLKYPAGLSASLDSVTLNISKLTATELNLTTSQEIQLFEIFTMTPEAELRLIPKQ